MKKNLFIFSISLLLLPVMTNANPADFKILRIKDSSGDNRLTKKEKKAGWILLFDGKSLNNWRTFKNINGSWQAKNGMICSEKPITDNNPDLISTDMFENFELSLEWKLSPQGNSGIMYMVTETTEASFISGPEYQLIDDDNFPHPITEKQKSGADYDMYPPLVKATKTPGEWNLTVIKVNKGHVEHWLNGQKVVEYTLWTDGWKSQKEKSKWKEYDAYGASKKGHIAFQASHSDVDGTGVCFKNIKIKPL